MHHMEELTLEELTKYTVRIQQDSFIFYRKAARILEGNEMKQVIDELADFKADQLKQLKDLLIEYTLASENIDYMVDVDTDLFDDILDNGDIPAQATPRNVLMLSLNREDRTAKTYDMILNLPHLEERTGQVYRLLLKDEREKISTLRKRVEKTAGR
jgi:rubrerythrin